MMAPRTLLIGLLLIATVSMVGAVSLGSVPLGWRALGSVALNKGTALERTVILDIRLPRAVAAFAVGGLLALAGALMQVLLRNPLADPYVLGISGGAAVATLGAMLLGVGGPGLTVAAFAGALLAMALVFALSRGDGGWNPARLLLTGVVVASGWAALIGFILTVSPDSHLKNMLFWLMGDLGFADNGLPALAVLALGLTISLLIARDLNVLARGELQAMALGVATGSLSLIIYVLASLLTASAVTLAGSVGFVGLIVPHLIRLLGVTDHRLLLPCSVLLGGSLVVAADTFARTALAPQQLPVGIITALLGVPMFLYLLNRRTR
ncbi:MAG: iron ABC transporter permease [Gammaproteobacteria bacterium]|jgi:iron complex transport system permease protein